MQFDKDKVNEMTTGSIPLAKFVGAEVIEMERGYVKMAMPFEQNVNHIGIMYAGSIFTLGELPGGALFFSAFDPTQCYPIVPATEPGLKFCLIDGTENPSKDDPFFMRSSLSLAKLESLRGNEVELMVYEGALWT